MNKASIAIFRKSIEYDDKSTPLVPDEIFEAATRVIQTKGMETVRTSDGFFLVKHSETGPFKEQISDDWLPVYIARISAWSSGGIRSKEMEDYKNKSQSS